MEKLLCLVVSICHSLQLTQVPAMRYYVVTMCLLLTSHSRCFWRGDGDTEMRQLRFIVEYTWAQMSDVFSHRPLGTPVVINDRTYIIGHLILFLGLYKHTKILDPL